MAEFIRGGASLPHRDKNNFMSNGCDDTMESILPPEDFDLFAMDQDEDTTDGNVLAAPPDNLYV